MSKKEEKIKILLVEPDKEPKEMIIDNTLASFQRLVGGNIEAVTLNNCVLILNEEGKLLNLKKNILIYQGSTPVDMLLGNIVVTKTDRSGLFVSLPDEKIHEYKSMIKKLRI